MHLKDGLIIFLFYLTLHQEVTARITFDKPLKKGRSASGQKFVDWMQENMTGKHWFELLESCDRLRNYIKKYYKEHSKLDKFDLEYLIDAKRYRIWIDQVLDTPLEKMSDKSLNDFGKYMKKYMNEKAYRKLLHWILQYETSTLFINPPPKEKAPAPLWEEPSLDIHEDLILDFLKESQ